MANFIYFLTIFYMKRFITSLATLAMVAALSVVPAFAEDANQPPADPAGSNSGTIATPVSLSDWFTSEQLALLSVEEQKTLADKLNALAGDPAVFKKKVAQISEWLNERLEEQKEKMENQAQWEAKQKAKFEAKVDAQFEKLMREKKEAAEKARRMQEKAERLKRLEAKKARMEAERARRLAKPKVLNAWVASVDAANGVILLKKEGAQAKVLVNAKTVLVVMEDDGARVGTLADFQAGDRLFGLVRRNPNDHSLVGVVLVKMQAHQGSDEEEEATAPPTPPADSGTPPADTGTPPPTDSGSTPPST